MADISTILNDPEFHKLPTGDKLKLMRDNFEDFATLTPSDQGKLLNEYASKVSEKGIPGMEKLGALPPVTVQASERLRGKPDEPIMTQENMGMTRLGGRGIGPDFQAAKDIHPNVVKASGGVKKFAAGDKMGGAADIAEGALGAAGRAALPLAAPALAAAPVATLGGAVGSALGSAGARGVTAVAGGGEDAQRLAGAVGSVVGGAGGAAGAGALSAIPGSPLAQTTAEAVDRATSHSTLIRTGREMWNFKKNLAKNIDAMEAAKAPKVSEVPPPPSTIIEPSGVTGSGAEKQVMWERWKKDLVTELHPNANPQAGGSATPQAPSPKGPTTSQWMPDRMFPNEVERMYPGANPQAGGVGTPQVPELFPKGPQSPKTVFEEGARTPIQARHPNANFDAGGSPFGRVGETGASLPPMPTREKITFPEEAKSPIQKLYPDANFDAGGTALPSESAPTPANLKTAGLRQDPPAVPGKEPPNPYKAKAQVDKTDKAADLLFGLKIPPEKLALLQDPQVPGPQKRQFWADFEKAVGKPFSAESRKMLITKTLARHAEAAKITPQTPLPQK